MTKAPWHLWVVGILALIWNAGGGYDYYMTKTAEAAYMAQQPEERLAMLAGAPLWFDIAWAVGVWGAIAGSLLLLVRSRYAGSVFALSIIGLIAATVYTFGIADGGSMLAIAGPVAIAFTIAIPVILIGLFIYARTMRKRRVLA